MLHRLGPFVLLVLAAALLGRVVVLAVHLDRRHDSLAEDRATRRSWADLVVPTVGSADPGRAR